MTISKQNKILLILVAGILNGIAYNYFVFWLSWFSLIPFFLVINNEKPKISFLCGFSIGVIVSIFLSSWIYRTTQRFTGSETELGIVIMILSILYYSFWWGLFAFLFNKFKNLGRNNLYHWQILFGASLWTLLEFIRGSVSWYHYIIAHTQTPAPILIQISSITGVWGISFFILLFNLYIFYGLITKEKKLLFGGAAVLFVYLLLGLGLMNSKSDEGKPVKFVLFQENIDAQTKWMPETGDSLANIYFHLAEKAVKENPDFIIWSETAIPWVFSSENDLLEMVLNKTATTGASHIFGTMYPTGSEKYYNSVLLSEANGEITGRYDKKVLIPILEKPLFDFTFFSGIKLDFFSSGINDHLTIGAKRPLLSSKGINFGTIICNESLTPVTFANENANIILSVSNDAWIEGSMLPYHHFYITALRAVENNKYVVINSNKGISGIINASGKVIEQGESLNSEIIAGFAFSSNENTIYSRFGDTLIISLLVILILVFTIKTKGF